MRLTSALFLALIALASELQSQNTTTSSSGGTSNDLPWRTWVATPKRYFEPLIADPRAAHQQATVGHSKSPPFLQNQTEHALMWDIDVGAEIPLIGRERGLGTDGRVASRGIGFGSWFVFDFHMIEDLNDTSNPILNTDYQFSILLKAQKGLGVGKWFAVKAEAGHESTHLGDEYSLAAQRLFPTQFERINVSYEWLDAAVSFERHPGNAVQWIYRLGLLSTLPFGDSYYSIDTLETNGRVIPESSTSFEYYLGAQRRSQPESLCWRGNADRCFGWYWSTELRMKVLYDFNKSSANESEKRRPGVNILLGVWPARGNIGSLGVASLFTRFYYGVNPHGQFRNESDFWLAGFGLRLDR